MKWNRYGKSVVGAFMASIFLIAITVARPVSASHNKATLEKIFFDKGITKEKALNILKIEQTGIIPLLRWIKNLFCELLFYIWVLFAYLVLCPIITWLIELGILPPPVHRI